MTARYRCPFCGSYSNMGHKKMQEHFRDRHTGKLLRIIREAGLKALESYDWSSTTRKDPNAPPRRLKDHLQSNPGDR